MGCGAQDYEGDDRLHGRTLGILQKKRVRQARGLVDPGTIERNAWRLPKSMPAAPDHNCSTDNRRVIRSVRVAVPVPIISSVRIPVPVPVSSVRIIIRRVAKAQTDSYSIAAAIVTAIASAVITTIAATHVATACRISAPISATADAARTAPGLTETHCGQADRQQSNHQYFSHMNPLLNLYFAFHVPH